MTELSVQGPLTVDGLRDVMRAAAGEDEAIDLRADALDVPFLELGVDSLGLLETVALIKRQYGVEVTDDELADLETPRALLAKVNERLA